MATYNIDNLTPNFVEKITIDIQKIIYPYLLILKPIRITKPMPNDLVLKGVKKNPNDFEIFEVLMTNELITNVNKGDIVLLNDETTINVIENVGFKTFLIDGIYHPVYMYATLNSISYVLNKDILEQIKSKEM